MQSQDGHYICTARSLHIMHSAHAITGWSLYMHIKVIIYYARSPCSHSNVIIYMHSAHAVTTRSLYMHSAHAVTARSLYMHSARAVTHRRNNNGSRVPVMQSSCHAEFPSCRVPVMQSSCHAEFLSCSDEPYEDINI